MPVLSPRIAAKLAETGGRYIEPFVGGAAMALSADVGLMHLSDACEDLIGLYRTLRDGQSEQVSAILDALAEFIDKSSYYEIRDGEQPTCPVERAARFIYLNKVGYNGLHRENKGGKFNVPFGRPSRCDRELFPSLQHLQGVADVLQAATLAVMGFVEAIRYARSGDLLYIDPPYDGGYVGYVAGGFTDADQERLAAELYYAVERGAAVVGHNAMTDRVKYLYGEWADLEPTGEKRPINSDSTGRGDAPCVMIYAGF